MPANDPLIREFGALLDSLQAKVLDGRQQIADVAVRAQELIKERGGNASLLDVVQSLDQAIPPGAGVKVDDEAAAALVESAEIKLGRS